MATIRASECHQPRNDTLFLSSFRKDEGKEIRLVDIIIAVFQSSHCIGEWEMAIAKA